MKTPKILITLISLNIQLAVHAQKFDIFTGTNFTKFKSSNSSDFSGGKFESDWKTGYQVGMGFEYLFPIDGASLLPRLSLQFQNYKSNMDASLNGHGGGVNAKGPANKSVLGFNLLPLVVRFNNGFQIGVGFEYSILISDNSTGKYSFWNLNYPSGNNLPLKDQSNKNQYGLTGRLAYNVKISKKITFVPQYIFYNGFSEEYDLYWGISSIRHTVSIGLVLF